MYKIMFLIHEYPPIGGGAGVAARNVCERLAASGNTVTVVTTGTKESPRDTVEAGVRVIRIPTSRRSAQHHNIPMTFAQFLVRGVMLCRRLLRSERFDVIQAFMGIPAGLLGVLARNGKSLPLAISLQGSDVPGYSPDQFEYQDIVLRPLVRYVWKYADAVTTISRAMIRLARWTDRHVPIELIYNGVDTQLFSSTRTEMRTGDEPLRVLCVSRLVQRKGIQHLIEALGMVRRNAAFPFTLTIAGDGDYAETLQAMAKGQGLDDIEWCGPQPHQTLPELYAKAEVYALPTLTEAFGITFCEAMSSGLPVIATTVGSLPEIVREGVDGWLVTPGDSNAVYHALLRAWQARSNLAVMGVTARKHVQDNFSWDAAARQYERLYCKLVEGVPRKGLRES